MDKLYFLSGPLQGATAELIGEEITIGRAADNGICIDDESISDHHAVINRQNRECILRDLQSAKGTTVQGNKVIVVTLEDSNRIAFGSVEAEFSTTEVKLHLPKAAILPPSPQQITWPQRKAPSPSAGGARHRSAVFTLVQLVALVALAGGGYFAYQQLRNVNPSGDTPAAESTKAAPVAETLRAQAPAPAAALPLPPVSQSNTVAAPVERQSAAPTALPATAPATVAAGVPTSAATPSAVTTPAPTIMPAALSNPPSQQVLLPLASNSVTSAEMVPANSPLWQRALNLMPLINPAIDSVKGKWSLRAGTLVAEPEQFSRIQIPFEPPEEYDFRIVFNRLSGEDEVSQYFSQSGRMAMWQMGAIKNTLFGFQLVGGIGTLGGNRTTVRSENCLRTGQATSVLAVRKTGVKAYLDGKLISEWATDFSDASLDDHYWSMPDKRLVGLAAHKNNVVFYRIELLEITGRGKPTRGGMPAAVATTFVRGAAPVFPNQQQQPAAASGPSGRPLVCPVQLVLTRAVNSNKNLALGAGNRATYHQTRSLTIFIRNTSREPVSGIAVRWGIVRADMRGGRETAYGTEEIIDLKPLETKTIETASISATGRRWNYRASDGQKISGHAVQVRVGGQVIGEDFSPASVKAAFEKLQPVAAGQ